MSWPYLFVTSLIAPSLALASLTPTQQAAPMPVFLRLGFSSVLEFEDAPTRVVLGDSQAFQVERLDKSLVLRTLVAYATSNMFAYFKEAPPKLFVLTASEEAEPTYFRKIEVPKALLAPPQPTQRAGIVAVKAGVSQIVSAIFDPKKDYLTVETKLCADSNGILRPNWNLIRLRYQTGVIVPFKLWAERKEIQKDATVRARFIFAKPNIPRDLTDVALIVPIEGQVTPLSLNLKRSAR